MDGTLATKQLAPNIWTFNESVEREDGIGPQVDAYLITGADRALVVDALMQERGLYRAVRGLTDLPLELVVTHGHPDHAGAAVQDFHDAGCTMYIPMAEKPVLESFKGAPLSWFQPLEEGMVFDLGGVKLEVLMLPGHTPGGAMLLDRENQLLYTGDAIGAGVFWMHTPVSLPLHQFLVNVKEVRARLEPYNELVLHTGHRHQAPQPLTRAFMDDVIYMTEKIVSGEWVGEDKVMRYAGTDEYPYKTVAYKLMGDYCYNPDKL